MKTIHVATTINGDEVEFACSPAESLLDVLRDRLGLTGTLPSRARWPGTRVRTDQTRWIKVTGQL